MIDEWVLFCFALRYVMELKCLFTRGTASCAYSLVFNDERQTILLPTFVGMLIA